MLAVEADNITVTRNNTPILRGVSCRIPQGSCTAILGPNGSGKTTFTRTLTAQMYVTSGSVTVLGARIGQTDVRALRKRIGVVNPAAGYAGTATVDDELTAHEAVLTGFFGTIGLYEHVTQEHHAEADRVLDRVGLAHRCGHRFSLLSTGEQRRCLIARALVGNPELLILDEPTAGMDIAGREQVLATIEQLLRLPGETPGGNPGGNPGGPTVLLITHHVEDLSPRTQQVILMRDGVVTACGTADDVITPENLTQLYGCKVYVHKKHGRFWLEVLPEAWLDLIRKP